MHNHKLKGKERVNFWMIQIPPRSSKPYLGGQDSGSNWRLSPINIYENLRIYLLEHATLGSQDPLICSIQKEMMLHQDNCFIHSAYNL